MSFFLRVSGLVVLVSLLSGCATMFSDSADNLTIESEPAGASVYFQGNLLGKTPLKTSVPRESAGTYLVFKKEGYATKTVYMQKSLAGSAYLNIFFILTTSGVTSWGIDFLSGKMFEYNPKSYVVELEKSGRSEGSSALEYMIGQYQRVRKGIARHEQAELLELCHALKRSGAACEKLTAAIHEDRERLLQQPHGLALYREVIAVDRRYH